MRKKILTKIGLMAVIVFSLAGTTCETLGAVFSEPLLSLQSVELTSISFTGATFLCKVNVENPNPVAIPFPELDWEFFVNTNSFVKGVIKDERNDQRLRARGTTVVEVPVSITYLEVFNTFTSLRGSDEAGYRIALAVKFTLPILGDKVWNFAHEGTFPIVHLPSISFAGIRVKNQSLTNIEFEVAWEIENNNNFAMSVNELSYNFTVNNAQWSRGGVPGSPQIGAKGKTQIPLTFSINTLSMVTEIISIIARGTSINYACNGNINLGAALPGLVYNEPFSFTGSTRLQR